MCACDFDLKLTFISCGWEGSASDAGVLLSARNKGFHMDSMNGLKNEKSFVVELFESGTNGEVFMKTKNPDVRLIWLKRKIRYVALSLLASVYMYLFIYLHGKACLYIFSSDVVINFLYAHSVQLHLIS